MFNRSTIVALAGNVKCMVSGGFEATDISKRTKVNE